MDTRKIAVEYRLGHWAQIIREQKGSGQSIKAYCEEQKICLNVFFYWQRKIRAAAREQLEIEQGKNTEVSLPVAGFAEVKMVSLREDTETSTAGQLHIEVGGMRLSVEAGYPVERLAELLRALARPC